MWNRALFKEIVSRIVKEECYFEGKHIKTRVELYELLAAKLFVEPETVKGWSRNSSNGPGDKETLRKLERLLNVKLTTHEIKGNEVVMQERTTYSDFVKENLKQCYLLVINYIRSCEVDSEEHYLRMIMELDNFKCFIPENIFDEISDFITKFLEPVVYEGQNYFSDCFSSKFGDFDGEVLKVSEDEVYSLVSKYYEKLIEVDLKFQELCKNIIYPLIMN